MHTHHAKASFAEVVAVPFIPLALEDVWRRRCGHSTEATPLVSMSGRRDRYGCKGSRARAITVLAPWSKQCGILAPELRMEFPDLPIKVEEAVWRFRANALVRRSSAVLLLELHPEAQKMPVWVLAIIVSSHTNCSGIRAPILLLLGAIILEILDFVIVDDVS